MSRASKKKSLKNTIYIFTEGETEKNYFKILNKKYNSTTNVKVTVKPASKQGRSLLKHAMGKIKKLSRQELSNLDGVYIIFDRDDIPSSEVEEVIRDAKKYDIKIGYSNSCFEVWLLAHFIKPNHSHTKDRSYELLGNYLGCSEYSKKHKNDSDLLKQLEDFVSTAIENTKSFPDFDQTKIEEVPYTNIGRIIQQIYKRDVY
ncbi:RloB family protein [Streptococcus equinus]|uniref:RloB family protein n=1 Tax=Streptococcus equinus TaxID=1335 RepID=UPI0008ED7ECE|nr:RloB family protein [Streptococcus equinus]SFQ58921.1 RloB-like protein [Streptococcus equinus]